MTSLQNISMKTTALAFKLLATINHSGKSLMTTRNAKITKIIQSRLMKLQKFESKLVLSHSCLKVRYFCHK